MKNLDGSLIRYCLDLDDSKVDAGRGKEAVVGIPQPAHGVGTPCLAAIPDEPLHPGICAGGIPPDDGDGQSFREFERELQFGVSLEGIECARCETEIAQDRGISGARRVAAPESVDDADCDQPLECISHTLRVQSRRSTTVKEMSGLCRTSYLPHLVMLRCMSSASSDEI